MSLISLAFLLLTNESRAQEPETCHFEGPVSMGELREAMKTCVLPVGSVITLRMEEVAPSETQPGIGFRSNDSALTDGGKQTLDGVASIMSVRKKLNIKVVGYADSAEQGDLLDLSLRRAQVASAYLISKGIDPARVTVEAAGADGRIDSHDTAEGHARNRRVEFVVSAPKPVE